jgi:DNA-binding transcriptional MerR regulator
VTVSNVDNIIAAFTEEQAARLTGVSQRQLRLWASDGFFPPSIQLSGDPFPARLYSFRDLLCLKVIHALRTHVSFQHLRKVKHRLAHLGDDLWAKTTLYLLNRTVVFNNPETGEKEEVVSGQGVLQIPLIVVSGDMHAAVRAMRERPASEHGSIDTKKGGAKHPVIAGTRIPVRAIQDFAEAGYTVSQIMQQYPSLDEADVRAALKYKSAA